MIPLPGSIMQIAYVVDDLAAAAERWVGLTDAGPFFVLPHLQLTEPRYRGAPTDLDCSIALGYSGSMCVELIEQHDDAPSVFRELTDKHGPGFHHWAIMTEDFDSGLERYVDAGHQPAFSGAVAIGGRFAYVDTVASLGGMIELIELTPKVGELFNFLADAASAWDGKEPLRTFQ